MSRTDRSCNHFLFVIPIGETASQRTVDLDRGCFGTLIVEAGDGDGAAIQFVAVAPPTDATPYPDTDLLSTPKLLALGANALTAEEITEVGAARSVRLELDAPASAETRIWLLWKS